MSLSSGERLIPFIFSSQVAEGTLGRSLFKRLGNVSYLKEMIMRMMLIVMKMTILSPQKLSSVGALRRCTSTTMDATGRCRSMMTMMFFSFFL